MEDEYSSMSPDLRQFIDRPNYTSSSQLMSIPQASPSLPVPNFFSPNHRPHQHPSFLNLTPPVLHDHPHQHAVLNSSGSGGGGLLTFNHHYHEFGSDYSTTNSTTGAATNTAAGQGNLCRFDVDAGGGGGGSSGGVCTGTGCEVGTVRWPRQETLTLLEIRSKLDLRFKEANQKGPLWEEVSRIMAEEHGYERSGKKCREKFENLYKYYKKTKEGKAGKQNGKHYRFFRQLEALYGEQQQRQKQPSTTTTNPKTSSSHEIIAPSVPGVDNNNTHANGSLPIFDNQISGGRAPPPPLHRHHGRCPTLRLSDSVISASNHSSLDTTPSSSDGDVDHSDDDGGVHCNAMQSAENNGRDTTTEMIKKTSDKRRGRKGWKAKVKEFIDKEMSKLVAKQELWLERMMTCIQHKEQERMLREEEWRKQDGMRLEQQHKIWANERAWIEARDANLLEVLQRVARTTSREAKDAANDVRQVMLAHQQQRQLLEAQIGHHQQITAATAAVARSNHQDDHPPHHDHSPPGLMITRNNHDEGHGQGINIPLHLELLNRRDDDETDRYHNKWDETEILRLIQLRTELESRFEECGRSSCEEDILWENIATRMACSGYERSAAMCKDRWDYVNKYYLIHKQYCCSSNPNKKKKRRKDDWESTTSRSSSSINGSNINDHDHTSSFYNNNNNNQISGSLIGAIAQGGQMVETTTRLQLNHDNNNNIGSSSSPSTSSHDHPNVITVGPAAGGTAPDNHGMAETYFRFLVGDGVDNLWENYGLKPNKGGNQ